MAAQDKSDFSKAESPDEGNDLDDEAEWIDRPEEGESIQGILLERTPEAGQFDSPLYKLRRTDEFDDDEPGPKVLMWSLDSIDRTIQHNDISPGDELLIEGTDTYTFEGDDGEEQEAVNYELYFK
jgi:hypothetical protein